ncbi:MAG: dockerin type I repeat-containing protein [candidate division Zixibacteria bacterium]|nr:dockerin type I repeat-containing protein [candidate division Zixibacteria bacterium]
MLLRSVTIIFLASILILSLLSSNGMADPPEEGVISTACKRLAINNYGGCGLNTADASLDYIDDCDTFTSQTDPSIYLSYGMPLVGRVDGTDTLLFHLYGNNLLSDNSFLPVAPLEIDSISDPTMIIATTEFITADSSIGCILEYFAPTAPDTCEGIVQRYRFYNNTDGTLTYVTFGCLFDWDVPSDSGLDNTSDFIGWSGGTIYQQGYEYDNTTNGDCGQLEDDRFAGIKYLYYYPQNGMTLDNATWIYDTGPFGAEAPLPAGPVFDLMWNEWDYSQYSSSSPDSIAVDLSTLITFGVNYSFGPVDTLEVFQVLSTGKTGLTEFHDEQDKTCLWAENHGIVEGTCCSLPGGDANGDGPTNVGDAVYIISYSFKGGPAPSCMSEADANNDGLVNVADAIRILWYSFKQGPFPRCGHID